MTSTKVLEQLAGWRKELVNLNRTNRLLYFRHTKTSTVGLSGRTPDQLLTALDAPARTGWGFVVSGDPEQPLPRDHVRTDKADVKQQESALLALERKANQEFLDKGLWVLYVALGMLAWKDPKDDREALSPLVLVPVTLARSTPREPYRMRRADEDLVVNPALEIKLRTDFGIDLPGLETAEDGSLESYFAAVEGVVGSVAGRVERAAVLAPFSFHKEVMFRDLLENAELIAEHPVVNALADPTSDAGDRLAFDPVPDDRLDEEAPPEEMASVLPADSSQRRCIVAARSGKSFVMDGPPGTGKSQTITNIIAELLKDGRTVLFVSEKAAALEVVRSRLGHAGLGEFVLELHSHKATRKEVAQELGRSLGSRVVPGPELPATDRRTALRHREQLSAYAEAMNEPRTATGVSVHATLGRLAQLQDAPVVTRPQSVAQRLDVDMLSDLLSSSATLGRAWGPVERGDEFLWQHATGLRPRATVFGELLQALRRLDELTELVTTQTRLPRAATVQALRASIPLLEHLSEQPDVPASWLTASDLAAVEVARTELSAAQEERTHTTQALSEALGARHRELSPDRRDDVWDLLGQLRRLHWTALDLTSVELRSVQRFLETSVPKLEDLRERAEDVARRLGLSDSDVSLTRTLQLAELGELAGAEHRPEAAWLDPLVQEALDRASKVLSQLVDDYREREAALSDVFEPDVLYLDLPALERRFREEHKWYTIWGKAQRADKRALADVSKSGKAGKDVRLRLGEAREWQALSRKLEQAEDVHADVIGSSYYHRTDTDFGAVVQAVEVARRAVELVGREAGTEGVLTQLGRGNRPDSYLPQDSRSLRTDASSWQELAVLAVHATLPDVPLATLADWCTSVATHVGRLAEHAEHVESVAGRPVPVTSVRTLLELRRTLHDAEQTWTADDPSHVAVLGPRYAGLDTDLELHEADLDWARRLRQLLSGPVSPRAASHLLAARPDAGAIAADLNRWDKLRQELVGCFEASRHAELTQELSGSFDDIDDLLRELQRTVADIEEWRTWVRTVAELESHGLGATVQDLVDARAPAEVVPAAVERALWETHVDHVLDADVRLATYRSTDRDHLVHEFQAVDRQLLATAPAAVINALNLRRPRNASGVAGIIQREAQKKTRHMPVRKLLAETAAVTQRLKPCFMMSPLTVSQFLTSELSFDVVIFDEASQVLPADAVNCIYRAQQVIVAGDQKQLPPTSFFTGTMGDDGDDYDEEQLDQFESVLDLCKGSGGFPSLPLLWHYRSQHESLITFSNYMFYEGSLVTFPGALERGDDVGVEFIHVPDGEYRRGGPRDNPREAAVVVDRVLDHARRHPTLTCGVVAFSEAQAAAIELELDRRRGSAPELDAYFASDRLGGFFVKNLENVQGDERDVIIFSIGYGPDESRKITMNFGPVNRAGGWRRLNVAATRARQRVEVVSSIVAGDIRETTNESVLHLKRYLDYAERGMPALAVNLEESQGGADSPFEEEVTAAVRRWGYDVVPQVGSAGYRIDMGVRHPERPGSFALGIECDGVMYHSSKVARDRDRLREEVLRGLGWDLHRIWGTAWYRDRAREEERLHEAIRSAVAGDGRSTTRQVDTAAPAAVVTVEEVSLTERPVWAETYVVARVTASRRGVEITDPRAAPDVARIVQAVVEQEGPLHRDRVLRRVRDAYAVGRSGARVREAVDAGITTCVRAGEVEARGSFIGAPGTWHRAVRVPDEDEPESRRKVEELPEEELRLALQLYVSDAHAIDHESLLVATARLFGWGRVGADIRVRLEDALDDAVQAGQLVERSGRVELP